MIIDRRRSVGSPQRCSGYVPKWLRERTEFDDSAIFQEVIGIRIVGEDGTSRDVPAPGYILDRTRFDKTLAIRALESGADLANALVLKRNGMRVVGRRNGIEAEFSGEYILGADGPNSVIGKSLGQVQNRYLATMQFEVGLCTPEEWVEFYRSSAEEEGLAWFVPCGRTAQIGVGVVRSQAKYLKARLSGFLNRLHTEGRIYGEGVLGCTGGLVPLANGSCTIQKGAILLAGDAGGISEPFSGVGIATAVVSGEVAGDLIGQAFSEGSSDVLRGY